jgi:hypothetical protein
MKLLILLSVAAVGGAAPQTQAVAGVSAAPAYLSFSASDTSQAPQSLSVAAPAGAAWAAATQAAWLQVSPGSGTGPGSISVALQPSGLLPGIYSDAISVSVSGYAAGSVPVTLVVPVARGAAIAAGNSWYVSPDAAPTGDGSIGNPWDIVTAFNAAKSIQPGDTVWLREGRYGSGTPDSVIYNSLAGSASAPILVRPYPGERAIIDAWLQVGCCDQAPNPNAGAFVWFWGLEFASYNPDRTIGTSGPPGWAAQANHAAIDAWAPGTKVINCIVHDTALGIELWEEAPGAEAYGNIVYNVGGYGTDRGHGHGFHVQNASPSYKHIVDNISFNNFGEGMQLYGSGNAFVQNFHVEANVSMNNGSIGSGNNTANGTAPAGARGANILIGAGNGGPAGIVVIGNYTYHTPLADDGHNDMSYNDTPNANDITALGNYFIGGREAVDFFRWNSIVFRDNTVYSANNKETSLFWSPQQNPGAYAWDQNRYFGSGHFDVYNGCVTYSCSNGRTLAFGEWQSETGVDANSTFTAGPPNGVWTFVRPNIYEPGRANIVIYNWDLQSFAQVDLSAAGVRPGDYFEIRDGENWFGGALVSGVYSGGTVTIPMAGLQVALPNGVVPNPQPHTAPQFGVFVVLSGPNTSPQGRRGGLHGPGH